MAKVTITIHDPSDGTTHTYDLNEKAAHAVRKMLDALDRREKGLPPGPDDVDLAPPDMAAWDSACRV